MLSHNHAISGIQGRKTFFTSVEKKLSLQQWKNLLSFRLDKCENLIGRRIDLYCCIGKDYPYQLDMQF